MTDADWQLVLRALICTHAPRCTFHGPPNSGCDCGYTELHAAACKIVANSKE